MYAIGWERPILERERREELPIPEKCILALGGGGPPFNPRRVLLLLRTSKRSQFLADDGWPLRRPTLVLEVVIISGFS